MLLTLSSKGQITIPKSVRESLNLQTGDTVALIQVNDEIILKPIKKTIFDLVGSIPAHDPPLSEKEIREATIEYVVNRYQESEQENG